jgi:hypothetical protein
MDINLRLRIALGSGIKGLAVGGTRLPRPGLFNFGIGQARSWALLLMALELSQGLHKKK